MPIKTNSNRWDASAWTGLLFDLVTGLASTVHNSLSGSCASCPFSRSLSIHARLGPWQTTLNKPAVPVNSPSLVYSPPPRRTTSTHIHIYCHTIDCHTIGADLDRSWDALTSTTARTKLATQEQGEQRLRCEIGVRLQMKTLRVKSKPHKRTSDPFFICITRPSRSSLSSHKHAVPLQLDKAVPCLLRV